MNQLVRLPDFERAQDGYQLSKDAKTALYLAKIALVVGPAGSGRNTAVAELRTHYPDTYKHVISKTTREIRYKNGIPIESNGDPYWFCSEDEVLADILKGDFIEWAIIHRQQVSGLHYRELLPAIANDQFAIKDMEPVGAANVHRRKSAVHLMYVVPALTFDNWLSHLRGRSDLPDDEIRRRLTSADSELQEAVVGGPYRLFINDQPGELSENIHHALTEPELYPPDQEEQDRVAAIAVQLRQELAYFMVGKTFHVVADYPSAQPTV